MGYKKHGHWSLSHQIIPFLRIPMTTALAAVGEWMLLKIAHKVADEVLTKVSSETKAKIQSAMGKIDMQLEDLNRQLVSLKSDQGKILAKLDTLSIELKKGFADSKANDAEDKIMFFLESYHDHIAAAVKGSANRNSWSGLDQMRNLNGGVASRLSDFHRALVNRREGSPGLIELTVDYYWNKYEQGLDAESFKYDILSVRKDLVDFMENVLAIQLIGLYLLSMISQDGPTRQQHITRVYERFEDQALTFRKNIPSFVDISRVDCDEFLTRSYFRLQWWTPTGVTDEYLSSGWVRWYKIFPWDDQKPQVIPFVNWSALDHSSLTDKNPKAMEWKFEKSGDFFFLVGYSVEWLRPADNNRKHAILYTTPQEVKVAMESQSEGRVEKPGEGRELLEGARDRYTARWNGDYVLFKVIVMRSKMKKNDGTLDDKPIVRIVDTKWWSRSNELSTMFNADAQSKYIHQINYI